MTNAEVRQRNNTKDNVTVAHSVKWKWRGHMPRMDRCRWADATSMWDVKSRQKENLATEDPMGRHVQESSSRTVVTNSQKPARMEYTRTFVKAT